MFPDEDEKHASRMRLQSLIKFLQYSDCEFGHVSKPPRTQMDGPARATAKSVQYCKNWKILQTVSSDSLQLSTLPLSRRSELISADAELMGNDHILSVRTRLVQWRASALGQRICVPG